MYSATAEDIEAWHDQINDRRSGRSAFLECEYVCTATYHELNALWFRYHELLRVPWDSGGLGHDYEIGRVHGRIETPAYKREPKQDLWPIVALVTTVRIGPAQVAFVECTSAMVDFGLVEAWRHAVFKCSERQGYHANADNFGNIVADIEKRHQCNLIRRERILIETSYELDLDASVANIAKENSRRINFDPQANAEYAETKTQWWGERAEYWRAVAARSKVVDCKACEWPPHDGCPPSSYPCDACFGSGKLTVDPNV
jgi:hypothetical protein